MFNKNCKFKPFGWCLAWTTLRSMAWWISSYSWGWPCCATSCPPASCRRRWPASEHCRTSRGWKPVWGMKRQTILINEFLDCVVCLFEAACNTKQSRKYWISGLPDISHSLMVKSREWSSGTKTVVFQSVMLDDETFPVGNKSVSLCLERAIRTTGGQFLRIS